jgi:hypothetical protein
LIPFISTGYCCAHPYSFFCDWKENFIVFMYV